MSMSSYILENSSFASDIEYEWAITELQVLSEPLNDFHNIVRRIKWCLFANLKVSEEIYSEMVMGENTINISELNLDNNTFISYENLTPDIVISWIEQMNPEVKETIKNKLLDRKIYKVKTMSLPWDPFNPFSNQEEVAVNNLETEENIPTSEPIDIQNFSQDSVNLTQSAVYEDPPENFIYEGPLRQST